MVKEDQSLAINDSTSVPLVMTMGSNCEVTMARKNQPVKNQNDDPILYTAAAGEYLGVHPRTLNNWVSKKKHIELLKPMYVGRKLAFRRSALEAFLSARTVKA